MSQKQGSEISKIIIVDGHKYSVLGVFGYAYSCGQEVEYTIMDSLGNKIGSCSGIFNVFTLIHMHIDFN